MQEQSTQDVTMLLRAWTGGDERALDRLMPVLFEELRRTARSYMRRERSGHTLQTTALVNEAYLKLFGKKSTEWENRAHFYVSAARTMRRILVKYARADSGRSQPGKRADAQVGAGGAWFQGAR